MDNNTWDKQQIKLPNNTMLVVSANDMGTAVELFFDGNTVPACTMAFSTVTNKSIGAWTNDRRDEEYQCVECETTFDANGCYFCPTCGAEVVEGEDS